MLYRFLCFKNSCVIKQIREISFHFNIKCFQLILFIRSNDMKKIFFLNLFVLLCGFARTQTLHYCVVIKNFCVFENITVESGDEILLPQNKTEIEITRMKFIGSKFGNVSIQSFFYKFIKLDEVAIESSSGLSESPNLSVDNRLSVLKVEKSDLNFISDKTFISEYRIKIIRLNNNQIKSIAENSFEKLKNLEKIEIKSNKISWLPENLFANCTNLNTIDLSSNLLKSVAVKIFSRNLKLAKLLLANNEIVFIEKGFLSNKQYKNLEQIDLTENFCVNEKFKVEHSSDLAGVEKKLRNCAENFFVAKSR